MSLREENNYMELTKNNLKEWKKELDKIAESHFGKHFSSHVSDDEYLQDYIGEDTKDVLRDNLSYCY